MAPERSGLPLWRSLLVVPTDVRRYVEKAADCGADAVILDLEDGVAADRKAMARGQIAGAVATAGRNGADILVRINQPLDLAVRDVEAVVSAPVTALMLPKIESASHVRLLAELVEKLERERGLPAGHTRLVPMIETPAGCLAAVEIAAAHPRNVGILCGPEDLALALGCAPESDLLRRCQLDIVIAARAAGILPLGLLGAPSHRDPAGFRAAIEASKASGFSGSPCIHPAMVPLLNQSFAPSSQDIAHAEAVGRAFAIALAEGRGTAEVDGRMVDLPVARRAERLLALAAAAGQRPGGQNP